MHRHELARTDPAVFTEVAVDAQVGYLGLVTAEGDPRVVPLNFAAIEGVVYFHGALEGEKFERARDDGRCSFSMCKPYSLLPSHWTAAKHACSATQLFKSVEIRGRCNIVDDPAEKAVALQALMEKYQPEGGYEPIGADKRMYVKALERVGVFRVSGPWTAKVKFGSNEPVKVRRSWIEALRERGEPLDMATADEIEKTLGGDQ